MAVVTFLLPLSAGVAGPDQVPEGAPYGAFRRGSGCRGAQVARHGFQRRKFAISLRPVVCDFSGWNCVPMIVSRPTMAVMGPA